MAVTAAPRLFGVAVQLGLTNAAEFCAFLDYCIKSYPFCDKPFIQLETPSIDNYELNSLHRSRTDELFERIVREAEIDSAFRSVSAEIDSAFRSLNNEYKERGNHGANHHNKARNIAVSIAKPVPVVISYRGEVGEDRKTITPRGFKINGSPYSINLKEHLEGLSQDGLKFKVTVLKPAEALIQAAAIQEKDLLSPGDQIYSANIDTSMSGASGTIAEDGTLTQISVNDKAGHEKMPYVDDFRLIEGHDRLNQKSSVTGKKGYVALYITGNDPNNRSGKKRGLMATVEKWKDIKEMNHQPTLYEAVGLLNKTLKENGVGDDLRISNQDVKLWNDDEPFPHSVENYFTITDEDVLKSSIINTNQESSDQEIIQAARDGDKFAQALVLFTLIRISQALAQSINSQIPNKQPSVQLSLNFNESPPPINSDKPVAFVFVTSSFNHDLNKAVAVDFNEGELQSRVIQSELKKLGHPGILWNPSFQNFNPELDGTPLILEEQLKEGILKDLKTPHETAQ